MWCVGKSGFLPFQNKCWRLVRLVSNCHFMHIYQMFLVLTEKNFLSERVMFRLISIWPKDIFLKRFWTFCHCLVGIQNRMKKSWVWMKWFKNLKLLIFTRLVRYSTRSNLTGWMVNTSKNFRLKICMRAWKNFCKNTKLNFLKVLFPNFLANLTKKFFPNSKLV